MMISIVTPSFNQAGFLEDAIRSVLAQNYSLFEHIVIDNCSTDGTLEILKKYPHLKWISEPDRGQSDALNKGFMMARGEIIGWLNCDEVYLQGAFNKVVSTFESRRDIEVLYGDTCYWLVDQNKMGLRRSFPFSPWILKFWGLYFNTSSTFLRRRFIDEHLFLDLQLDYHMDHELMLRLNARGYLFEYVPVPLSVFRVHCGSKTSIASTRNSRIEERARLQSSYASIFRISSIDRCIRLFLEWTFHAVFGLWRRIRFELSVRGYGRFSSNSVNKLHCSVKSST